MSANVLSTARTAAYEADLPSEGPAHLFDDPFHCSFRLRESRSQYVQLFVPYSTGPNGFNMSLQYTMAQLNLYKSTVMIIDYHKFWTLYIKYTLNKCKLFNSLASLSFGPSAAMEHLI